MSPAKRFPGLRAFLQSQDGNIAVVFALMSLPLFGIVGGAVDYARWHSARSHTKAAMDMAVIAGTRTLLETDGDTAKALGIAREYYSRNVEHRLPLLSDQVSFRINSTNTGVTTEGNAHISTPILSVLNIKSLPLIDASGADGSTAEFTRVDVGNLEVSLMLDVTGSMCDDGVGPCLSSSKLDGLKTAAKKLIDIVVSTDQSKQTSKVAIVPFSTRVRVAPDGQSGIMKALTNMDATWSGWYNMCVDGSGSGASETNGNWTCNNYAVQLYPGWKIMPCVTERFYNATGAFDLTDDAPGSGAWLNAHDGGRMTVSEDSSDTKPASKLGKSKTDAAEHWNYSSDGACADISNANLIMPLSSDITAMKARIDGLEAYGSTGGVLGTVWSWYMLSPKWDSIWSGESKPESYALLTQKTESGAPKLRKVAILMTDGAYNTYRGWKEQDPAYVSQNAVTVCENMKAKGIEVFTVGFALANLGGGDAALAQQTLQSCGSDIEHFYNTIDEYQLSKAFESIANKVTQKAIALSK